MSLRSAPSFSLQSCPFPAALIDAGGEVLHGNIAWADITTSTGPASDALGLVGSDTRDFAHALEQVQGTGKPLWLDLDAHVLKEMRWARCHIWPSEADGSVLAAIIPLRETRTRDLSRHEVEHIERIIEHTADAITIVDHNMKLRFASGIATRWLGTSGAAHEGQDALTFIYPDDHHILIDAFSECIVKPRLSIKARFRVVHQDGGLIWVEGIGTNMFDDPAIRGILVTLNDITELVENQAAAEASQAALEAEKQHFEALAQFTPTGVFELNADNQLSFRNERFAQLLGIDAEQEFTWDLFDERDREALQTAIARTRAGSTTQSTVRLARPMRSGGQRWLTIRAVRQDAGRILGSVEDATSQIVKQAELTHRADHDDLTGLPNREHLLGLLHEFTHAGEPLAVLFLDLDNFKDINDGLGHQVGDQVLVEIAERLSRVVRPLDIVGRLHGDEFLIVCRDTSSIHVAREIAARVVDAVGAPLKSAPQRLVVSGSIGIAMSDSENPGTAMSEDLIVAADVAMYEAKRLGGARSVPYNDHLGKRATDRLRLRGELQRASELDELVLHYQPIVDLRTRQVDSAEALIRWHHPTQGFILPERFIPDIEQSELIDQLGMWVLERAVMDLAGGGPEALPVNVNVSPRQLYTEGFASATLGLLEAHGVAPSQLTIEITELMRMDDFDPVEAQLRELQREGVGVAVDDFGTGYSALSYLQRYPFDQVKIDGVFIEAIDTSASAQAIVGSIVDLVTSLGATPVAERVERQEQITALIELGCPYAQGFLLGKPEPAELT